MYIKNLYSPVSESVCDLIKFPGVSPQRGGGVAVPEALARHSRKRLQEQQRAAMVSLCLPC